MNFKTTYILFVVLVLVLAAFGLTQLWGLKQPKEKGLYVLPSLNDARNPTRTEDIQTVEIERSRPTAEKLVFYRSEQGWKLKQPAVRVDGYQVDRVIDQVRGARRDEKADVTSNLQQFGLDQPATTVTLRKADGAEWKLNIGNESLGGDKAVVYVTSSDHKTPLAVRKTELDALFRPVNDFRAKDLLGASALNTSSISVQLAGQEQPIVLEKTSDGQWRFQKPALGQADYEGETTASAGSDKKITGVRDLIETAGSLRVQDNADFVAEDVSDAELAEKYGLEKGKPATLRIEVKRTGNLLGGSDASKQEPVAEVLLIGKKAETKGGEDEYYARLENEKAVVRVPARTVDQLVRVAENPQALRNRDLIQVDAGKTDAIDIKNASGLLELRRTGSPETWKLYAGTAGPRAADDQAVQDLLTALNQKRQVKEFPPASRTDAELGLEKPTAEIALWVEGIKKDEKKEEKADDKKDAKDEKKEEKKDASARPQLKSDKPKVRLVFGRKEGDLVYVRREEGDDRLRVAVPASLLEKVTAGPLAYLDRTLPTFPTDADVTKLVLVRDGQTYELSREKKDDKGPAVWKVVQPKELAGRSANAKHVEDILSDLRRLHAEKLIAEKPSEGELERFGLKAPSLRAVATMQGKDGKAEERVYSFGKETESKDGRYATLSGSDLVFLVRPGHVASLSSELLDPTVFRFDPAKATNLKLQGWQKLYGFVLTLDLERKAPDSKEWVVKSAPMGFTLDNKKVEEFVAGLSNLQAERFLTRSDPKPEHKLGKGERALEIEIRVTGEKEPLTLVLGDAEGKEKKAYHAQSSAVPGDVFLVAASRFQKLLEEGAKFFSTSAPAAE